MDTAFPPFHNSLPIEPEVGRFDELHLYTGALCNRTCTFCCVNGSPTADYTPWTEATLQMALALVAHRGSLKFYGGEPTLDVENQKWALSYLRQSGFEGTFTIFSNGIRAKALLDILETDARTLAVLNYSIATGRGEKPLPHVSQYVLEDWANAHPNRLFVSHDFVVPVGRQAEGDAYSEGTLPTHCFRCWPTLTSSGMIHACPFAVEEKRPHYDLGKVAEAPGRFTAFLHWIESELEPEAARRGKNSCAVCTGLISPHFAPPLQGRSLPIIG